MSISFSVTTAEMRMEVLKSLASAVMQNKHAPNKMVSMKYILEDLRARHDCVTRTIVQLCLEELTLKGVIRFFKNDNEYVYFGVSESGWEVLQQYTEKERKKTRTSKKVVSI